MSIHPSKLLLQDAATSKPGVSGATLGTPGEVAVPHINPWRGATARDVENTLAAVECTTERLRQSIIALLVNLNENLTIGARVNIDSFLGTLADLQSDLTSELMGVGDQINE